MGVAVLIGASLRSSPPYRPERHRELIAPGPGDVHRPVPRVHSSIRAFIDPGREGRRRRASAASRMSTGAPGGTFRPRRVATEFSRRTQPWLTAWPEEARLVGAVERHPAVAAVELRQVLGVGGERDDVGPEEAAGVRAASPPRRPRSGPSGSGWPACRPRPSSVPTRLPFFSRSIVREPRRTTTRHGVFFTCTASAGTQPVASFGRVVRRTLYQTPSLLTRAPEHQQHVRAAVVRRAHRQLRRLARLHARGVAGVDRQQHPRRPRLLRGGPARDRARRRGRSVARGGGAAPSGRRPRTRRPGRWPPPGRPHGFG